MGRIQSGGPAKLGSGQAAHHHAESISPIAHGQQLESVLGTAPPPAATDGFGGGLGRERAFEFVRDDENVQAGNGEGEEDACQDWGEARVKKPERSDWSDWFDASDASERSDGSTSEPSVPQRSSR